MLDKYHLKSNRKIEVKYLEHSYGKQGKWKKGEEINFQSSQKIPGSSLPSLSSGILPELLQLETWDSTLFQAMKCHF